MLPVLLAAVGAGLLVHHYHIKKHATPTASAAPIALHPATSATPPAGMQPAVAVHGQLMMGCNDPNKLRKAAAQFGAEGLPELSQSLLAKAAMIHDMMHGAKAIVERCRAGDQHAMAMAKAIGDNARAGDRRAQLSAYLIELYTKQNPASAPAAAPSAKAA